MKRNVDVIPPTSIQRCHFSTKLWQAVDDRVDSVFKSHGKKAPFGDFRRTWWREHCQYMGGPTACPYEPRDCALAFLSATQRCVDARRPGAMFRTVAQRDAVLRMERKPLARERPSRSPFVTAPVGATASGGQQPGHDAGVHTSESGDHMASMGEAGDTLRRPISRPTRIGSMLGSPNAGSREVPADDGQEGTR
jgi:hypothetical protein